MTASRGSHGAAADGGRGFGMAYRRFAGAVAGLTGWRRSLAAMGLGMLATFGVAPFYVLPALIVALTGLVWLLDGVQAERRSYRFRAAAWIGWCFGFGFFFVGLFWVGEAFLVDAEKFAALLPLAVTLLPAGLALFWAAAAGCARLFWPAGYGRIVSLALAVIVFEWLRGHILTGFPWNLLGESFGVTLASLQAASVLGIYGLTFLAVLLFASPATQGAGAPVAQAWRAPLVAAICFLAITVLGALRLSAGPAPNVQATELLIVQGAVPQEQKWDPSLRSDIFARYLALSMPAPSAAVDEPAPRRIIIWPEAAFPYTIGEGAAGIPVIADYLDPDDLLIMGAVRSEAGAGGPNGLGIDYYNSVFVLDGNGAIIAAYDKAHLVPFGEYLPLKGWLESIGLRKLANFHGSFATGPGARTLDLPGAPSVGPLVCYEIIFPEEVVEPGRRPGWLANLTNDAWFGRWAGPYQHLAQARMRSVEQGLPIARAANTGISAMFDPFGRELGRLGLFERGRFAVPLPEALPPTPYARFGDLLLVGLMLLAALSLALLYRNERKALFRAD